MLNTALAIGLECLSSTIVVVSHMCGFVEVAIYVFSARGVARILGKGVLKYARDAQKCKPRPLINRQGRSSKFNCQRERVMPMQLAS